MALITLRFDFLTHFLDERGQRAGFVLLAAFLGSFLFIRTSARLMRSPKVPWWPGSVTTESGLHLHHLVWGIVLVLLAGFLGFAADPRSPWNEILAGFFGVGCGFTLDEFALWIYLRDVYWAEKRRASFDAVIVAALLGGLVVLGLAPLDLANGASSVRALVIGVVIDVLLSALAILKGKPLLGLIGLFIPFFSLVGVLRLASPRSPWARRRYAPAGHKLARAQRRWQRIDARRRRVQEAIAGAPGTPVAIEAELSPPPTGAGQPGRDD